MSMKSSSVFHSAMNSNFDSAAARPQRSMFWLLLTKQLAALAYEFIIKTFLSQLGQFSTLSSNTPSAPLDLKAAIVATRFVSLSWSPPQISKEPINGYSIFYNQEGSDRERVVNSTRGNLEEINIQGLRPGSSYIFRVVARNQHGGGASSQPLRVTTQAELDVPGPVSHLEAKATTSFSILVSWSQPSHTNGRLTHYKLYYRQVKASSPLSNSLADKKASIFN